MSIPLLNPRTGLYLGFHKTNPTKLNTLTSTRYPLVQNLPKDGDITDIDQVPDLLKNQIQHVFEYL